MAQNPTRDVEPIESEDDQLWHDREEAKIDADYDRRDSARQRWLDGVDSGTNREYL